MTFFFFYLYYHFLSCAINTLSLIGSLMCLDLLEDITKPKSRCKRRTMKTCVICFDQFGSEAVFRTMLCTHYSCHSCLARYFIAYQEHPRDDYTVIACPVPECPHNYEAAGVVHRVLNYQQTQVWWHHAIAHSRGRIVSFTSYTRCTISELMKMMHVA